MWCGKHLREPMEWPRLVGFLNGKVSFMKEPYQNRRFPENWHGNLGCLYDVTTLSVPYRLHADPKREYAHMYMDECMHVCIYMYVHMYVHV